MFVPAILAQIEAEKTIEQNGFWNLVSQADPIVKLTLVILLIFSVVSWAIIFYKYKQVKQAERHSETFWNIFGQSNSLENIMDSRHSRSGPLYEIFAGALEIITRFKKENDSVKENRAYVVQKLAQTREEEIYKLEQYTPFLATTASTAPFVGLFGTVWGILTAFWAIGKAGSSSLATVGPYISEALIATAMGLAAAIPAVIAYNYFVHRIKVLIKMMDLFSDDLILKLEKESTS